MSENLFIPKNKRRAALLYENGDLRRINSFIKLK